MIHLSLTHSLGVLAFTILGAILYGYIWSWHFISFFESTPASVFDFIVGNLCILLLIHVA